MRYGVDNPTKLKEISCKISIAHNQKNEQEKKMISDSQRETMYHKYGGWYTGTEDYKNKTKENNIKKYGVGDHRSTDFFKKKVIETFINRYGVKNASHLPLKFKKSWFGNKINGFHTKSNLTYQGTYELDFLEKYCSSIKINKIEPIQYRLNENLHFYHPDFYLPDFNLVVEVKSSYTFNYELEKNLAKREYSIKNGYNFIFIIDKNYDELELIISNTKLDYSA